MSFNTDFLHGAWLPARPTPADFCIQRAVDSAQDSVYRGQSIVYSGKKIVYSALYTEGKRLYTEDRALYTTTKIQDGDDCIQRTVYPPPRPAPPGRTRADCILSTLY